MTPFIDTTELVKFIREGIKDAQAKLKDEINPDVRLELREEISQLRKQLKEARRL